VKLKLIEGNRHMKASAMNSKKKAAKNKSAGWRISEATAERFTRWLSFKQIKAGAAIEMLMEENPVTEEEIRRASEDLRKR
jgi:hypothetical protein